MYFLLHSSVAPPPPPLSRDQLQMGCVVIQKVHHHVLGVGGVQLQWLVLHPGNTAA